MDQLNLKIEGHVLITDVDSGDIIINCRNAIHLENMSFAIVSTLTGTNDVNGLSGFIKTLAFGNGGVLVDGAGNVTYNSTNTTQVTSELYNKTYSKNVDNTEAINPDNNAVVVHSGGTSYSDIVVTCTLDYGEPAGQDALDNTSIQEGDYVFDEIGLVSQQGRLLTHLIFHPVQKSANRKFQVVYTVRISAG